VPLGGGEFLVVWVVWEVLGVSWLQDEASCELANTFFDTLGVVPCVLRCISSDAPNIAHDSFDNKKAWVRPSIWDRESGLIAAVGLGVKNLIPR